MDTRLEQLNELYNEMWMWGRKYDPSLVKHNINAVDISSRLFIVGQSHAEEAVRVTGVNWFKDDGNFGSSGKNLEAILNCIGHSICPSGRIQVSRGSIKPRV